MQVSMFFRTTASCVLLFVCLSSGEAYANVRVLGKQGKEGGEFFYPYGITSLPSGEIVVADTSNNRIQVFTLQGQLLRMWGKRGSEAGEFLFPQGVTTLRFPGSPFNEIIVADTVNHRIQVFTSGGRFLRMWGKRGSEPGEFEYPCGVVALSSYEVVVADTFNHRIQVFNWQGDFLRTWGEWGYEQGQLRFPSSITSSSGSSNEVYVVDTDNHRIQVFTPEGQFLRMWGKRGSGTGEFMYPYGITLIPSPFGSSYEIIITDMGNHRIQVFTSQGEFIWMWGTEQERSGNKLGEFEYPRGIALLFSGEIAVVDKGNHRIQIFTWGYH